MRLFNNINRNQTKKAAYKKLSQYRRLQRIAGEPYSPKVTTTYSFEPKSSTGSPSRQTETMVLRKVAAEQELDKIREAINAICDPYQRQIIIEKYCSKYIKSDIEIYMDLDYTESEFYRLLEGGILEFAESYRNGNLLVFESEDDELDLFGRNQPESAKKLLGD